MNHFLAGDTGSRWREFESNLYNWRFTYPHLIRMVPGQPSARRDIQDESSIFLSISDNYRDRKAGARSWKLVNTDAQPDANTWLGDEAGDMPRSTRNRAEY